LLLISSYNNLFDITRTNKPGRNVLAYLMTNPVASSLFLPIKIGF
jgi:hypothetical protein